MPATADVLGQAGGILGVVGAAIRLGLLLLHSRGSAPWSSPGPLVSAIVGALEAPGVAACGTGRGAWKITTDCHAPLRGGKFVVSSAAPTKWEKRQRPARPSRGRRLR